MTGPTRAPGEAVIGRPLLAGAARRGLLRVERVLVRLEGLFGIVVMSAMASLLLTQVVSRYVVNLPLFWVEEVARLTVIWMVFMGIGYAVSMNTHLTVTALTDPLPDRVRLWLERLILVCIIATGIVLSLAGLELVDRLGSIAASSSDLPRSLYFYPTVIGFVLAAFQALVVIVTRPLRSAAELPDEIGLKTSQEDAQ